jgi:uncharacterized membrane protein
MAGIGFELRKLTRGDDLLGIAKAYAHSALTATGPWLMTIIAFSSVVLFGSSIVSVEELNTFRLIIIYDFALSLVITGPIVMLATRILADSIYVRDVRQAPSLMISCLFVVAATELFLAVPFYLGYVNVGSFVRLLAVANFSLIAAIWLVSTFLTALKNYNIITGTFGVGMIVAIGTAVLFSPYYGLDGMLLGFDTGLAVILFGLIASVLAEYPYHVRKIFDFRGYFRKYWQLAASGLVYNAAIWVDKWVMWAAPEAVRLKSKMISYPDYDSAMFLAYLSIVPSIAAFVLSLETDFFEHYLKFYRGIQQHATFEKIQTNHRLLIRSILRGSRNFLALQASLCVTLIVLSPQIFSMLNINFLQIGMFRIGVLGAFFHVLFLTISIILSYFDLRRTTLKLQLIFLLSNGLLTYAGLRLGFPYYGYGYFLASLIAFATSFVELARFIGDLPYQTFVVHNDSVKM